MAEKKKINVVIEMMNIGEEPIVIEIGGAPGDGSTEYTIQPGKSVPFHEGYCKPVQGAGRNILPSIMARKSMRTFPDGVRRPVLVPVTEAESTKAAYAKAVAAWRKAGSPAPKPAATPPPPVV